MSLALALVAVQTGQEWMERLESRLREARTWRVEARVDANGALREVRLLFAAPDRLTCVVEGAQGRRELRAEAQIGGWWQRGWVQWFQHPEGINWENVPAGLAHTGVDFVWRWMPVLPALEVGEIGARDEEGWVILTYRLIDAQGAEWDVELLLHADTALPARRRIVGLTRQGIVAEEYTTFELDGAMEEGAVGVPDDFGFPPPVETHPWIPAVPRVSVDLEDGTLARACGELMEQTGWTFWIPAEAGLLPVSVDWRGLPAGEALSDLERRLPGYRLDSIRHPERRTYPHEAGERAGCGSEGNFRWVPVWGSPAPSAAAGPFLLRVEKLALQRRITPTGGWHQAARLELSVEELPGTKQSGISFRRVRATTDGGEVILRQVRGNPMRDPAQAYAVGMSGQVDPWVYEGRATIWLAMSEERFEGIDRIEGILIALVPAIIVRRRVAWSGEPAILEESGIHVAVTVTPGDEGAQRIRVQAEVPSEFEGHVAVPAVLAVGDDRGEALRFEGMSSVSEGRSSSFEGRVRLPEGRTVGWVEFEVTGGRRRVELPFEIRDVDVRW